MTLLQILFLCIIIGCGIYFGKSFYDKMQTEKEMDSLQQVVNETNRNDDKNDTENNFKVSDNNEENEYAENGMLSCYYDLYNINNDMIGWVKIDGTVIDYPVVQSESSNAYYLHRNFYKEKSASGSLFADYQCDVQNKNCNIIIYGHNMRNGTMFHHLTDYEKQSFFKEHPTVAFNTLYKKNEYAIFSVFKTSVGSENEFKYYEFTDLNTEQDFYSYIGKCLEKSLYDTEVIPTYGDGLLTLSTCSYSSANERFVVVAKLINNE